jgi:ABC-type transport system substrate-binding protein
MERNDIRRRAPSGGTLALAVYLTTVILLCPGIPAQAETYLKVGFLKEPRNFNLFRASDAWTKKMIRLFYQPLYLIDSNTLNLIPWLAEDQPIYDPDRKTVTFHLRQMQWDDGTEFTAEDVVFTAEVFKRFQIPRYYAYWKFVKKIEALDNRTVRMTMEKPMAVFRTRTLTSRIVQKRKWDLTARKADKRLIGVLENEKAEGEVDEEALDSALEAAQRVIQTHAVTSPTGLGPFSLKEWKKDAYILLQKNDRFFGQGMTVAGQKLGPYIDGVMFKIYGTLSEATLALKRGDIDFLWKGVSQALVEDLTQDPHIRVPMTLDSGYRYLGLNLRKAPMSDPAFRRALAFLIDKDFIVKRILHNHGQRLDTFVPPENTFYFNPNTPSYGEGMERDERIREAYRVLTAWGYRWKRPPIDSAGRTQKGQGMIMPDGEPAPRLTILTPSADYDTEMASPGQVIQEWLQDFGIAIVWKPMAFGGLIHKIRNERDFDMFIMGLRNMSVDPDYLRRFFHSSYDRPNEWNYTGYSNPEFDRMADLQARTMDLQARRSIVLRLQSQLMMDLPYIPLFVPHRMEGIRTDRFDGWTTRVGGVGNIWSFCLLHPIRE